MADLRVNQSFDIWVNQQWRETYVLATHGNQALLEYEMPNGTSALRVVPINQPDAHGKSVSYHSVPTYWLEEMVKEDIEWLGRPQRNGRREVAKPTEMLA